MKALLLLVIAAAGFALAASKPVELLGVPCQSPPVLHCPDANCAGSMVTEQGPGIEPKSGRKFFLDYPCDLKRGEKVTFILSLHGGGSYGNWQRHYFPLLDYVGKYRLVVLTPNAPPRVWAATDDEYLKTLVTSVYDALGAKSVKSFWLVGHSQGGMTSNRLLRTDFFQQRVSGWLSLSGGRLGPTPPIPASFFTAAGAGAAKGGPPAPGPGGLAAANAALRELPPGKFSFIFETGEHELGDVAIPAESPWAERLGCAARVDKPQIVDGKAGYVFDGSRQNPGSDAWGRRPRGGNSQVMEYSRCKDGMIVADVVRLGKGHTEGLEPLITERLVQLMVSAKPKRAPRS